ncbi:hypothetical protein A6E15_16245 [Natrinema saccharevitans]|uniref:Uncharacterized protein n=1 Tax=Natrinema saccharevitans TaxID=301967 RepID=A0A1S8B0S3_9EURY|nr:hypothetical protein [Natrinema saccharevitans]OLZ42419.1 hypothetical protein A6E15_16245 [Natrinema saccharevitans]
MGPQGGRGPTGNDGQSTVRTRARAIAERTGGDGRFRTASNRPTEYSVVDPDDLEYADDRASVVAIGVPSVDAVALPQPET